MQPEQLVYVRRSVVPTTSAMEVFVIRSSRPRQSGRQHHRRIGFTETHFIQVLEGSHGSLDVLLLKLLIAERHTDSEILGREPIQGRSFAA